MTATDFERYAELLGQARQRPARQAEQLEELNRQSGADLSAAERSHSALSAQIAQCNDDLRRLRGPADRLISSQGITANPTATDQQIASLAEADKMMTALSSDVRSAQDAADWLSRAHAAPKPTPHPVAPPVATEPPTSVAASSPANSRLVVVGIAVAVVVVLIILALAVL